MGDRAKTAGTWLLIVLAAGLLIVFGTAIIMLVAFALLVGTLAWAMGVKITANVKGKRPMYIRWRMLYDAATDRPIPWSELTDKGVEQWSEADILAHAAERAGDGDSVTLPSGEVADVKATVTMTDGLETTLLSFTLRSDGAHRLHDGQLRGRNHSMGDLRTHLTRAEWRAAFEGGWYQLPW